jgi:hypothetical protein
MTSKISISNMPWRWSRFHRISTSAKNAPATVNSSASCSAGGKFMGNEVGAIERERVA